MGIMIYDPSDPPVEIAVNVIHGLLSVNPRRIAFAGPAGSGKTTLASIIGGVNPITPSTPEIQLPLPVFNHADGVKDEVLEWVATARQRALIPDEPSTFNYFCDFLGISPGIVKADMWEILGPTWAAMNRLLEMIYDQKVPVQEWAGVPTRERISEKVDFVDRHKNLFRASLQHYGQAIRDIGANPGYWAEYTVQRGMNHPLCLNADTRFPEEAEILRACGWTVVWLEIAPDLLEQRRAGITDQQRLHVSEQHNLASLADVTLKANQSPSKIVLDLAEWITSRTAVTGYARAAR